VNFRRSLTRLHFVRSAIAFAAIDLRKDSLSFVGWAIFSAHRGYKPWWWAEKIAHSTCFARELSCFKCKAAFAIAVHRKSLALYSCAKLNLNKCKLLFAKITDT